MQYNDRLESLFERALELEPGERQGFLERECGGDSTLLEEILSLVAGDTAAEQNASWNLSAIEIECRQQTAPADELLGEVIGPYQIVAVIGRGGMGKVYRAIRSDSEYRQAVAIKLIRSDEDTQEIINRFRLERQILADLDHPNIARLLDGGTTARGLPYIVMEYIEGDPLDVWCAKHKPDIAECLRIFRVVCSAVHDAHQHMVIHRDLKPGNILVTVDGTPKLVDFGISKLLGGAMEKSSPTVTGYRMMTPRYASPEQVRGQTVTTASDIYSLGVILYELLTGQSPYRVADGPMHEVTRAVCEEEPRRPGILAPQVPSDLDSITLMALRKDPGERYSSADQMAEDIRRYQEGYPIVARPDTSGYRARKFVGRNKTLVAVAALAALTMVGGIAATSWQAHLANRRFGEVRSLANSYLFEFHDAIKDLPGATPARQLVVKRALEFLGRLSAERGNDMQLGRELAGAYAKLSLIQGSGLGDQAGAIASSNNAVAILERVEAATPRNVEIGRQLAESYTQRGTLLQSQGDLAASARDQRKTVALLERLLAANPNDPTIGIKLAAGYLHLGDVLGNRNYQNLGDSKASLELYRKAQALAGKLAAEDPENVEKQQVYAGCWARLAQILEALGDNPGGLAANRRMLEIEERLLLTGPMNASYQRDAAIANQNLSLSLARANRLEEARAHAARSLLLHQQMCKADPRNATACSGLGEAFMLQARFHERANELRPALALYGQAIATFAELAARNPGALPTHGQRDAFQGVAELSLKTGDIDRVIHFAEKELSIDEQYLKTNLDNVNAKRNEAVANRQIGRAHELAGSRKAMPNGGRRSELREAGARYRRSQEILLALSQAGRLAPAYAEELGAISASIANCDKALAALDLE